MAGTWGYSRFSADQRDPTEKPHACPQCQRQFRRLEHLQRHVRTHTKERPYPCACGVSFTRRDLLKRHLTISHHPSKEEQRGIHHQAVDHGRPSRTGISFRENEAAASAMHAIESADAVARQMPSPAEPNQAFNAYQLAPEELIHTSTLDVPSYSSLEDITQSWNVPNLLWDCDPAVEGSGSDNQEQAEAAQYEPPLTVLNEHISLDSGLGQGIEDTGNGSPTRNLVSVHLYQRLKDLLAEYADTLPEFELPSQTRLDRYARTYFDGWTEHLTFVHEPTLNLEDCPAEFVLAFATIGAQWRHEQRNALGLYSASLAIMRRSMLDDQWCATRRPRPPPTLDQTYHHLGTAVILLGYATWESPAALSDISILVCIVSSCIQTIGLTEENAGADAEVHANWHQWLQYESRRRLCLAAFVSLETLGIAYNLPPALFGSRIGLRLPCDPRLWQAASAQEWAYLRAAADSRNQPLYRDALSSMLQYHTQRRLPDFQMTAQGGYVLMHGLLQRIHLLHEVSAPLMAEGSYLPSAEADRLRAALDLWSLLWDASSEANRDLSSFVSCTLLSLAHIRIIVDFSRNGRLASREPRLIADALLKHPPFTREQNIASALKYATYVLSFTIDIGMDSLAKNHKYIAAIRHAVAGFESAVFLSKWLMLIHEQEIMHSTGAGAGAHTLGLTDHEALILNQIRQSLLEACSSVDRPEVVFVWNVTQLPMAWNSKELALAVLAIWSRVLKHESSWSILGVMGRSLDAYASRLAGGT
ncbi:hypothetical protein BJX76DRAFT_362465 [Aspergillus varians]